MSPSYRVRISVSCMAVLLSAASAAAVLAQAFEDPRILIDLSPDPLARSPRLVGLGRLSLVVDDPHNRITLWDFAGNPAGLFESDSTSTLELRPGTGAASLVRDLAGSGRLRQEEAGGGFHVGYEAWRRGEKTVYGAIGDVASLRSDLVYSDRVELRSSTQQPSVMPIVSGVMPYTSSGRVRYALRVISSSQSIHDKFRSIRENVSGQFIDQNGEELTTPDPFTPDETTVSTLGGGAASSFRFGSRLKAAIAIDGLRVKLVGDNNSPLYAAEIREGRPYGIGQVSLVGLLGRSLEWGVDGRGWKSSSQQNWGFTISQGPGANALAGRGKYAERKEEGTTMRTRARWTTGSFEVGAGFNTGYRKIDYAPPDTSDLTAFNRFLNTTYDILDMGTAFPDSVIANRWKEWLWEAGGGLAWHLPARGGVVGVEYHRSRRIDHHDVGGDGPRRVAWDVRGGLEYPCTKALTGRVGYQYSWEDRDEFTRLNEYKGNTLTVGTGVHPAGSSWAVEAGYAIRWEQADFGDPGSPRSSRQQLAVQAHWSF